MSCNRAQLCGRLETRGVLRFSPAGVALVEFTIAHRSEQNEANALRKVDCVMQAIAAAEIAHKVGELRVGTRLKATGFLAAAGRAKSTLQLHVLNIELIE